MHMASSFDIMIGILYTLYVGHMCLEGVVSPSLGVNCSPFLVALGVSSFNTRRIPIGHSSRLGLQLNAVMLDSVSR